MCRTPWKCLQSPQHAMDALKCWAHVVIAVSSFDCNSHQEHRDNTNIVLDSLKEFVGIVNHVKSLHSRVHQLKMTIENQREKKIYNTVNERLKGLHHGTGLLLDNELLRKPVFDAINKFSDKLKQVPIGTNGGSCGKSNHSCLLRVSIPILHRGGKKNCRRTVRATL